MRLLIKLISEFVSTPALDNVVSKVEAVVGGVGRVHAEMALLAHVLAKHGVAWEDARAVDALGARHGRLHRVEKVVHVHEVQWVAHAEPMRLPHVSECLGTRALQGARAEEAGALVGSVVAFGLVRGKERVLTKWETEAKRGA